MNQAVISRVWSLIDLGWKIRLLFLLFFMFLSGFAELLTLGSILPFLTVLVDPTALTEIDFVNSLISAYQIEESNLVLLFSFIFGLCVITSSVLRLIILKINLKWCYLIISELSTEAFNKTLYKSILELSLCGILFISTSFTSSTSGRTATVAADV